MTRNVVAPLVLGSWLAVACDQDRVDGWSASRAAAHETPDRPDGGDVDGDTEMTGDGLPPLPPDCPPFGEEPPKTLACTGLYGDTGVDDKLVHAANRGFAPGATLWTDDADKQRWIALPANTQVDTSDPNGWRFPEGTRVWKEFAYAGKRVETRLMYKRSGTWNFATFRWNDEETEATSVDGAEVPLASGQTHSIPTQMQCNECHRGSRDKLLGFQQVLLGLPGAEGLDLDTLVSEGLLTDPPERTRHTIPDDGTGVAPDALAYLHVNCGVSCHNETGNAQANMSRMFLRIDPAQLDDATPSAWNVVEMTVGVPSMTANFSGGLRIVPGAPDESVLIKLAQTRGSNQAMPPLGTNTVDTRGLEAVRTWIERLGAQHGGDDADPASGAVGDAGE
jgi:hypothetical protein